MASNVNRVELIFFIPFVGAWTGACVRFVCVCGEYVFYEFLKKERKCPGVSAVTPHHSPPLASQALGPVTYFSYNFSLLLFRSHALHCDLNPKKVEPPNDLLRILKY